MVFKENMEVSSKPEVETGLEAQQFSALALALREGTEDGVLPKDIFTTTSLGEADLGEKTRIAPDGVSLFKSGDKTLKSREVVKVNLSALTRTHSLEADASLGASLLNAAEELSLSEDVVKKLQYIDDARVRDEQSKADFLRTKEETGYSRGDWKDWGDAELTIVKTTKKDGTVLMGALLGAITTTHVSLGGNRIQDDSGQSGLYETDDLWQDGKQDHRNVKVPLGSALSLVERLALDHVQEAAA